MRKTAIAYVAVAFLSLVVAGAAAAADNSSTEVQRLENTFSVTAAQISALQADGLGFGEIGIVFSLASNMTGGITTANVNTIMALRQGSPPMGWGQIANSLGLNLGKVVSAAASAKGASESASAGSNAGSQGAASSGGRSSSGGRGGR